MNQQDFENLFILFLSGVGSTEMKMKNEKEMWYYDDWMGEATVEFPTLSPRKAIIRAYWDTGKIAFEFNYKNGKLHGKQKKWSENGKKDQEVEYKDGLKHGISYQWYKGRLCEKELWENGNMVW